MFVDEELTAAGRQAALRYVQDTLTFAERYRYGAALNALLPPLARRNWLGLFTVARSRRLPRVLVVAP